MYLNQLTVIGFTGKDADFHFTSNGTPVTTPTKNPGKTLPATGKAIRNGTASWHSANSPSMRKP